MSSVCRLVAFLLLFVGGSHFASAADDRPNLLFILTDDQRQDTLGCTGNGLIQTPHLDRLAAEGTLLANATVNSAICTPSRACYFLGQYERRHGLNFNSGTALSAEAWAGSYPVRLREAGYFTGYVGKNHVPVGPRGYKSGLMEDSFDAWYAGHGHLTFYPKERHKIFRAAAADTQTEVVSEGAERFLSAGDFLDGTQSFLDRRPQGQPFCLSIALNLPHGAGVRSMEMRPDDPELYRTAYRDRIDSFALPKTYTAKANIASPKLPADVLYAQFRQDTYDFVDTPELLVEQLIRKAQTITGIDRMVGRLRDLLAAEGLAENTVIVFSSDHGIMNGEFGLGGKALNYEPCLRVPMIVIDPRLPPASRGRRSMALAESVDIAPTLLDYAGVPIPARMQGQSLRPLIEGREESLRESSFAENLWSTHFGNPRIESVRTQDWKYIRYFATDRALFDDPDADDDGRQRYRVTREQVAAYASWLTASIRGEQPSHEELFHLASDPSESVNLIDRAAYAAKRDELRAECDRLVRMAKGDLEEPPATVPLERRGG